MHGPLTYRLTYDASKWEQASAKTQDLVRAAPPGLGFRVLGLGAGSCRAPFRVICSYRSPTRLKTLDLLVSPRSPSHLQVRQQYIMEMPPGLAPDPSMFKGSVISVDDDAVDRQYRKLFGPPDAKTV
jgi:hypothetical protein